MLKKILLLTLVVGCHRDDKVDTRDTAADKAAKEAAHQTAELDRTVRDKAVAAADGLHDIAKEAKDVETADARFAMERDAVVTTMRLTHQIEAQIPAYMTSALGVVHLTETGRANVMEKLGVLELRLAEAARAIDELDGISAAGFAAQKATTSEFVDRMQESARGAIDALGDAPRATTAPAS